MIVGFEQDPGAPFGSGNFRDESGRMTYLHDPETASDFVTTMPGAKANRGGGGGAPAPAPTPARARMQTATLGLAGASGNAPPAPAGPATGSGAGAALVQQQAAVDSSLRAPSADPAAAGVGAIDPAAVAGATQVTPEEEARLKGQTPAAPPAAPAAPAAPTAGTGAGAALVQKQESVLGKIGGTRVRNRALPEPMGVARNGLPPARTSIGETVNIAEGRPIENVVEGLNEIEGVEAAGDTKISAGFDARAQATEKAFASRLAANKAQTETQMKRKAEARAERTKAEAEQVRLQKALKENDSKLDPDRLIRDMSTGKTVAMIVLAALNGGFGAAIGKKDNDVINAMNRAVDIDISRQKDEIASGKVRIGNLIDKFMKEGFDAKTAELLARDKIDANLAAYGDIEAQRVSAGADLQAQKDMLLQQRLEARVIRRDAKLAEGENRISRARQSEETYAVPPIVPGVTPQAQVAEATLRNMQIEQDNTKHIESAVGHPVSPDEAKEIKGESQDYGKRAGNLKTFRNSIQRLADTLGLSKDKDGGYTGEPETGMKWLGIDGLRTEQRRRIDRMYGQVQRADIMGMVREPSAKLQDRFGEITAKPWYDSDVPQQLNDLIDWANEADAELQNGFSDDAINYYSRKGTPATGKAAAPRAPAAGGGTRKEKAAEAAANTGGESIGTAPLPSTLDGKPAAEPSAPAAPPADPAAKKRKAVDARWE